ncbi:hypothetical protein [Streptomyces sp. NPDC048266]|uniref:hypothetical protein n=1 Tax=Streptomyces sp. NPDC048266 TaxID=3155787 RepID=UPI0033FDD3F3
MAVVDGAAAEELDAEAGGETEVADGAGLVPVADGGAVVPTGAPGASTPYARPCPYPRGAAYRVHAQVNTQVSAGPRARARALRSAGVTR